MLLVNYLDFHKLVYLNKDAASLIRQIRIRYNHFALFTLLSGGGLLMLFICINMNAKLDFEIVFNLELIEPFVGFRSGVTDGNNNLLSSSSSGILFLLSKKYISL